MSCKFQLLLNVLENVMQIPLKTYSQLKYFLTQILKVFYNYFCMIKLLTVIFVFLKNIFAIDQEFIKYIYIYILHN